MERRANIIIEKTSGDTTGKVGEGYVLYGDDGTVGDQIQDCDADLGEDVYAAIELAISGEDIHDGAGKLVGDVVVDDVAYRWTIRAPGHGLAFAVEAGTTDCDPNDGHVYDLREVAKGYVRQCEAALRSAYPSADIKGRVVIGPVSRNGASVSATEYDIDTHAAELAADAICREIWNGLPWEEFEIGPEMSITGTHPQTDGGTRFVVETSGGVEVMVTQGENGTLSAFTRPGTPDSARLCQAAMDFVREQADDEDGNPIGE
jgi:hypothetical protein